MSGACKQFVQDQMKLPPSSLFRCEKSVSNPFSTTHPVESNPTLNTHRTGPTELWISTTFADLCQVYLAVRSAAALSTADPQADFDPGAEVMTLHVAA